ncbi:YbjN domain-containing protein [Niabella sp. 22666]|jgi:ABC-type sugar transport system ATPase subunit|uniref:YbjN domain-containing protein n=1 Tax=Niabella yanshanensis TaxID=577386 RepID=A0ABZ0W1P8_9BACT|nr:YbjN domain-containing protein [Niabella yanshanensis]MCH5683086.1 YbjN domain-containing protein [Niabella sp. W65]ULT45380.1 YbjN domain-containing protein [Niabella sp. I65]HTG54995.1 YbjN domain-containing protein [Niabella sp.]MCH7361589.1 YbjN domain-containing protein [Niabella sp. W65]WQD37116.1 YbjN domain-containing protein [Niabella yanshanensis]
MESFFSKVKNYVTELDYEVLYENENDGIIVIDKQEYGIRNMVLGVANPILIVEQYLFNCNSDSVYRELLIKNRDIVHGAFVLDETGEKVIFRNTLQVESLDKRELETTINSLSLLLSEYSNEIMKFSK